MTIRPCDEFIQCECSDNPFLNLSAESPDPNLFFARRYFPNIPSLNETDSWYQRATCLGVCYSEESQQDADDCALRDSQLCTWNPVQPPLTLLSDDPSSSARTNVFGNVATSCTSPCPSGPDFTFTVPANTFYGLTQQEADALARSVCEYRALVNRMCSTIPPEPPVCDVMITSVMPPSSYQYALEGESVAFGVTFDYTGFFTPTFLWLKDGMPLLTTQNPSLTFASVMEMDTGLYRLAIIVPMCPPVLSPVFELIVCVPSAGSPAPFLTPEGYFSYTALISLGLFSVTETGNTNAPVGSNVDDLGGFAAGWYQILYDGGGRKFTDPLAVEFFTADTWDVRGEIGGVPDTILFASPYHPDIYATCELAEESVFFGTPPPVSIFGPAETTDTAGGTIKLTGPAWDTAGGWSRVACNGATPTIEIINYDLGSQPANLRIVDFETFKNRITVCPTCIDGSGMAPPVEWDGEFYRFDFTPFSLEYHATFETSLFKGKRTNEGIIRIILTDDNPPSFEFAWRIQIWCDTGGVAVIWEGKKANGNTPEGTYILDQEVDPTCVTQAVKCITIEAI